MLGGAALFAAMAICVGMAHAREPGLSTFMSSAVRSVVNLVMLFALERGSARRLLGDARPALWVRGILGAVALLTYFAAIPHVSLGEAAFLNQTSAVWVALVSPWLLRQRVGAAAWVAVAASLLGVALLGRPQGPDSDALGRSLGLLSGLAAAGAYVSITKAAVTNAPVTIVFWFTLVGSVASLFLVVATGAQLPQDLTTGAWLLAAGVAATVAQLWMTAAYRDGHAASVAAAGAAGPLLTALAGWAFLNQIPGDQARVGMALLLLSSSVLPFFGK